VALASFPDDLRSAARGLLRARGFALTAAATLALGIFGVTLMFAFVRGVLLRPLPVVDQDRLVYAWQELRASGFARHPFPARALEELERRSRAFESVAGVSYYYDPSPTPVNGDGAAGAIAAAAVTPGFFRVMGRGPLIGRALGAEDAPSGAPHALVISHALWQVRYGGASDVLGRRLVLGDQPFTIVGVMPPGLECPHGAEAWMSLAAAAATVANPAFREGVERDVVLLARLRPGATVGQARSELVRLAPLIAEDGPADAPRGLAPVVRSYADSVVGEVRPTLLLLLGAVGLVLLIASANVANLLLLRGESRRGELSLRAVLGASPGRLARLLLLESALIALLACAVSLAAAWLALPAVAALVPSGLPRAGQVRVDTAVLGFAAAVASAAAVLAGLVPALAARSDLSPSLRAGPRGAGRGARRRLALVAGQVALAVTVTGAAGLLTRSLLRLQQVPLGVAAERLAFVELALPRGYEGGARHFRLLEDLVRELEAAPSVAGATPVNTPPFAATAWDAPEFTAEGQDLERASRNPSLNLEAVHAGYFETLGVELARGRPFTRGDTAGAPAVAIVSEDVAERTWPGQNPLGRRLKLGGPASSDPWRTVVGVARPTRYRELARARATLYLPAAQFVVGAKLLALRSGAPLEQLARLARERVRQVDPKVAVVKVASFGEWLDAPLARPRWNARLIAAFGLAALLLASIGVYAVLGAAVRQRYPELGVRVALGARPADLRRLVLLDGLRVAAAGAAAGGVGAYAAGRLVQSLLYEVQASDPVALLGAPLLLMGVCALASCLPARRAARLDPLAVLKAE
jgi:predicted permease